MKDFSEIFPFFDEDGDLKNKGVWKKGKNLVRLKRVRYNQDQGIFLVLPVEGYNTRTYKITPDGKTLRCSCQWYKILREYGVESPQCSHKCAVLQWLQQKRIEKKLRREALIMSKQHSLMDYSSFGPTPGVTMP